MLNKILNSILCGFVGILLVDLLCPVYIYMTNPNTYIVQSAPWYLSVLIKASMDLFVILTVLIIKRIIKNNRK